MVFNCAETYQRLQDYLDRELTPEEIAAVEAHLALCGMCAEEYRFEESVLRHVRRAMAEKEPDSLASAVSDALDRL